MHSRNRSQEEGARRQESGVRSRNIWLTAWLFWSIASVAASGGSFSFAVIGGDAGAWPAVLSSIGLMQGSASDARVVVAPQGSSLGIGTTGTGTAPGKGSALAKSSALAKGSPSGTDPTEWIARVEHGTILVVEGESPLAAAFGFRASPKPHVTVRSVEDMRAPKLRIIWEKALDLPVFEMPPEAQIFARERWQHAPLMAGFRRGAGAVLWIATRPGEPPVVLPSGPNSALKTEPHNELGYERFPYILQALADLGLDPPFRSNRLWAFFDSSYRARVDLDYFAARWRASGISALHVAAWHYWERDPEGDAYLRHLIEACHAHSIAVYAWLELPHVSEKFWDQHPEWREKTALLQDAQLDWRKLMNLTNRAAFAEVSKGARDLIGRFDWDGVNLAELYFESLEGYQNPARLTPMNDDVRAEFQRAAGFDPEDLFNPKSERRWDLNTAGLTRFIEFRAELAHRQQVEWIGELEAIRKTKPHLDLVLTHVDDRFDTTMREKIGADAARVLPLLAQHDMTFLIEDPATIWNLGPQRYPQIAARYQALTAAHDKLAIDINIVDRYQDVYPTKQQTGTELFQLVHMASAAFERVALYSENSILSADLPLLSAAASTVDRAEQAGGKLVIESLRGVSLKWTGPAMVDGRLWPAANGSNGSTQSWLLLPRGMHAIEPTSKAPALRLIDFNGELMSAGALEDGIEFAYHSSARAMAQVDLAPKRVEIDGVEAHPQIAGTVMLLPRGQHLVTITK
jgi:hypothetical protein